MDYRLYNQEQDFSWSQPKQFNYDNDEEFSELDSQLVDKLSLETDLFGFNNTTPQLPQINNPNLNVYPITSTSTSTSTSKRDSHLQNLFNSKPNTFSTSFNSQFKQQPSFPPLNYSDSISSYNTLQSAPVPSTITIWFGGLPQNITSELFTKALQKHDCHPISLSTVIDRSHCAFASFIDPNVLTRLGTFEIGGKIANLLSDAGLYPHPVMNLDKSSTPSVQGSGSNPSQGHLPQTSQVPFTPKSHPQDRPKRPTMSSNPSFFQSKHNTPQAQSQTYSYSQFNQPSTSSSMRHENNAVAAAAAAASLTALSVLKTPHVVQAASAPNGPGQDVLEHTQHYLSLLVEGFQRQSSKLINEGSGQLFSQAEKIAEKLQQSTASNDKVESSQPQLEGEPSVIYTWKGDGKPRRYFILKALSKSDLDTSREENKWSTQAQNEEILNKAFNEASHVILFMSANKQRGFYGLAYKRMTSKIPNEEYANKDQNAPSSDIPAKHSNQDTDRKSNETEGIESNSIKTLKSKDEKTWSAPVAEFNDDISLNVQGERQNKSDPIIPMKVSQSPKDDDEQLAKEEQIEDTKNAPGAHLVSPTVTPSQFHTLDAPSPMEKLPPAEDQTKQAETEKHTQRTRTFGRPFSVEWLSTQSVPFSKLKGVNNPWNINRPVKVSRDGTEVETRVGEQLVEEFGISASGLDKLTNNDQ
ncbi:hypothetical protein E3Q12_00563 [Wallemia mellicola]|uniref:YTH domain-containing protein n=1 Tax=Wallemia mellicola TaxID=1708541 RepID=A0AB74KJ00_9BASI|nr:hypothetical protein E3Q12_00563 [Wallemia mellicola]TIC71447.1 hypothetical protein E3Q03_00521 [Wallemia mellicola]